MGRSSVLEGPRLPVDIIGFFVLSLLYSSSSFGYQGRFDCSGGSIVSGLSTPRLSEAQKSSSFSPDNRNRPFRLGYSCRYAGASAILRMLLLYWVTKSTRRFRFEQVFRYAGASVTQFFVVDVVLVVFFVLLIILTIVFYCSAVLWL